jgi:hypothetical protein
MIELHTFQSYNESVAYHNAKYPDLGPRKIKGIAAERGFDAIIKKLDALKFKRFTPVIKEPNHFHCVYYVDPTNKFYVEVEMRYGDKRSENSLSYKFQAMLPEINSATEFEDMLAKYMIHDRKIRMKDMSQFNVDNREKTIQDLKAISTWIISKNPKFNVNDLSLKGEELLENNKFLEFVGSRGCKIIDNYLNNPTWIRVVRDSDLALDPESLTSEMGLNLFLDGRIGMAYTKIDDAGDLRFLYDRLLQIPPIYSDIYHQTRGERSGKKFGF